jgi:hypothetical protein
MKAHDRVIAFDTFGWIDAGRPENRSDFWKTATILEIHEAHHDVPKTATIKWDHAGPANTSHGHHLDHLRSL